MDTHTDDAALSIIFSSEKSLSDKFDAVKKVKSMESFDRIALECSIPEIRSYALGRVENQEVLSEVVLHDDNSTLRKFAMDKLDSMYIETFRHVILNDVEPVLREQAVLRMPDYYQDLFVKLAIEDPDSRVRRRAVTKLKLSELDPEVLLNLAINAQDPHVRRGATYSISDEKLLQTIAIEGDDTKVVDHAIENINSETILKDIAEKSNFAISKIEAIKKIKDEIFIKEIYDTDQNYQVKLACRARLGLP